MAKIEEEQGLNTDWACPNCGSQTEEDMVQVAMWEQGKKEPVVITDIPARTCKKCAERFYTQETNLKIDLLRMRGFPPSKAIRTIEVPVFSLKQLESEN